MIRRLLVAASAALFTATVLVAPTPAQAATGWNRCPSGYFCIFTETGGGGYYGRYQYADGNLGDGVGGPTVLNNNTESVWNRTGRVWGVAVNTGYDCPCQLFSSGYKGRVADLVFNKVSSLCRNASSGSTCT